MAVKSYALYRIIVFVQVCLHFKLVITLNAQRVKETGSDGTDIHELTLKAFLCSEEDKHQALEIFGKRFVNVLTCSRLMMVYLFKILFTDCLNIRCQL